MNAIVLAALGTGLVVAAAALARAKLRVVTVGGQSMEPALHRGESVLAIRWWSRRWLKPGTIVVIRGYGGIPVSGAIDGHINALLIKRVSHVAGETVCIEHEELVQVPDCFRDWTTRLARQEAGRPYYLTLGDREVFVLADHRDGGLDSRSFGPVPFDAITGLVIRRLAGALPRTELVGLSNSRVQR